jgi:hypothetical protein
MRREEGNFMYKIQLGLFLFRKSFFKFSRVCLLLKKLINKQHFPVKKNLTWFPEKYFPEKFKRKTFSGNCEKFKNIILFADYIKFDPQIFDCYIYILF